MRTVAVSFEGLLAPVAGHAAREHAGRAEGRAVRARGVAQVGLTTNDDDERRRRQHEARTRAPKQHAHATQRDQKDAPEGSEGKSKSCEVLGDVKGARQERKTTIAERTGSRARKR